MGGVAVQKSSKVAKNLGQCVESLLFQGGVWGGGPAPAHESRSNLGGVPIVSVSPRVPQPYAPSLL